MKKTQLISIIFIILIYIIASLIINKSYILPSIFEILISLKNIIISKEFIIIVLSTLFRTLIGILISGVLAIILALLSYFNEKIRELFEPIYIFLKTIPNITYIIVSLIWLGRSGSVILVSSLVVFPILYNSFLKGLLNIDSNLINATRTFPGTVYFKIRRVFIPLIRNDILLALNNACSLGFKVAIMAEILSQINIGIGRELYYAKINFMMADIFAWTIIIIFISFIIDKIIDSFIEK